MRSSHRTSAANEVPTLIASQQLYALRSDPKCTLSQGGSGTRKKCCDEEGVRCGETHSVARDTRQVRETCDKGERDAPMRGEQTRMLPPLACPSPLGCTQQRHACVCARTCR
jgi:hypothetical protein